MRVLGLTGGIASGKSTAAAQLKELGVIVLDADRYGHRVYEPDSSGFHAVVNEFGHDIVGADGEIDRRNPRRQGLRRAGEDGPPHGYRLA